MNQLLKYLAGCCRFFLYVLGLCGLGVVLVLSALLFKLFKYTPLKTPLLTIKQGVPHWWGVYNGWISKTLPLQWHIEGLESLPQNVSYMVICNHQSWLDTIALQYAFSYRLPNPIFFFKRPLYWVPVLGALLWASNFIPVARYSKSYLAKHPERRGEDLERTRLACAQHTKTPVSVVNFVEGTRFSLEKQQQQGSPFSYLLKPRAGGTAFALRALEGDIKTILNVTVAYPQGEVSFWDYFCGKVKSIHVYAETVPVENVPVGDYENDMNVRQQFQQWLNGLWLEKDALLLRLKAQYQQQKRIDS
ncbi:MAG: acetyltransferase [Gammaproteobacteria bacterium]